MIAFAVAVVKWLIAGNWKWALPTAIALAAGVYAGTQRLNYLDCKAGWAADTLSAERAAREHQAKETALANRLVGEYAGEIAELQGKYEDAQIKLARVESNPACVRSPAARAFDDGVRSLEREAGSGDAKPAGRSGAGVPAPASPTGRLRRRSRTLRLGP